MNRLSSSKCKPAVEPLHVIFLNIRCWQSVLDRWKSVSHFTVQWLGTFTMMTLDYMQLPGESRINFVFAFLIY